MNSWTTGGTAIELGRPGAHRRPDDAGRHSHDADEQAGPIARRDAARSPCSPMADAPTPSRDAGDPRPAAAGPVAAADGRTSRIMCGPPVGSGTGRGSVGPIARASRSARATSAWVRPWRRRSSTWISRGPNPAVNCSSRSSAWTCLAGGRVGRGDLAGDLAIPPRDVQRLLAARSCLAVRVSRRCCSCTLFRTTPSRNPRRCAGLSNSRRGPSGPVKKLCQTACTKSPESNRGRSRRGSRARTISRTSSSNRPRKSRIASGSPGTGPRHQIGEVAVAIHETPPRPRPRPGLGPPRSPYPGPASPGRDPSPSLPAAPIPLPRRTSPPLKSSIRVANTVSIMPGDTADRQPIFVLLRNTGSGRVDGTGGIEGTRRAGACISGIDGRARVGHSDYFAHNEHRTLSQKNFRRARRIR